MTYKILADLVVFIQLLWIVFLLFGALIGVRSRPVKYLHIAGLGYAIVMQVFGWFCPLTHLEVPLRSKHDPSLGASPDLPGGFLRKTDMMRTMKKAVKDVEELPRGDSKEHVDACFFRLLTLKLQ